MRSRRFPLLSLHAPTLHDSILERVLTDVLVAHLDPETAGENRMIGQMNYQVKLGMVTNPLLL